MDKSFFFVWSPTWDKGAVSVVSTTSSPLGFTPFHTQLGAQERATMLAQQHPGHKFFVMQVVGFALTEKPPEIYRVLPLPDPG